MATYDRVRDLPLEIESYRTLADRVVGRRIVTIDAPDAWYLKGGVDESGLRAAIGGRAVERTAGSKG